MIYICIFCSILFSAILALQYWRSTMTRVVIRSWTRSFILAFYFPSFYSRTYVRAKKNSFRYNPSFSLVWFSFRSPLVQRNEPPLSRSFSRAHSSPTEINLMFSRISGLLISPPLIYRRRPCISTHTRAKLPACSADICLPGNPKTSVPRFSLI